MLGHVVEVSDGEDHLDRSARVPETFAGVLVPPPVGAV